MSIILRLETSRIIVNPKIHLYPMGGHMNVIMFSSRISFIYFTPIQVSRVCCREVHRL